MIKDVLQEAETTMKKAVEALRHQLASIRTGRASTSLVDHIHVDVYDSTLPLYQLANISVPETRMILIQPYDASSLRAIERAIQTSDLGLMPQNDGRIIRLNLPQLTEERRKELVKMVRARVEEMKISVRNHRREALEMLRELEHDKVITEDEQHRGQERIQEITDRHIKDLDHVGAAKEDEVMEV